MVRAQEPSHLSFLMTQGSLRKYKEICHWRNRSELCLSLLYPSGLCTWELLNQQGALMGLPGGDHMFYSMGFERMEIPHFKCPFQGQLKQSSVSVGARGVGFTGETLKSAVTAVLGEDKLLYSALKGLVKQNMNAAVWTVGQTRLFSKEFPFL